MTHAVFDQIMNKVHGGTVCVLHIIQQKNHLPVPGKMRDNIDNCRSNLILLKRNLVNQQILLPHTQPFLKKTLKHRLVQTIDITFVEQTVNLLLCERAKRTPRKIKKWLKHTDHI